jgi:hypothetical protein
MKKFTKEDLLRTLNEWMFGTNDFLPPIKGSFPSDYSQYADINPIDGGG